MSPDDSRWMSRACELALEGLNTTTPNPRVGCVLVSAAGQVVGEGYHKMAGTAHAEVNALAEAGAQAPGGTAYVTLEPCNHQGRTGACSEALIRAGVKAVVYGMTDPNPLVSGAGLQRLREAGVEVRGPVEEQQCRDLNPGYIKRMTRGRPFIRCKIAASLDGRTAMSSGESQWITGPGARADVQRWRARSCAIVTGVGTVLHDDPAMTVRAPEFGDDPRQPLRVVLDTHLRIPAKAQILQQEYASTMVATCSHSRPAELAGRIWGLPSHSSRVDLHALVERLAAQGCNEVLVEAGAGVAGGFLEAGLIDELIVYVAPTLLGSHGRPMFDWAIANMSERIMLEWTDVTRVGEDWRFRASPHIKPAVEHRQDIRTV